MKVLKAIIETTEHNYSAYIKGLDGIVATGSTISEIEVHLVEALNDYKDTCRELKCDIPEQLVDDYTIEFSMDVKSLLSIYSGIFTKSGLERLTCNGKFICSEIRMANLHFVTHTQTFRVSGIDINADRMSRYVLIFFHNEFRSKSFL